MLKPPRRSHKSSMPMLIVESNADHQLVIQYSILNSMPEADASFVSTANEVLQYFQIVEKVKRGFPRLLVMDICLPDPATGLELLHKIRNKYPRLPVIIFSQNSDFKVAQHAYELGASSFIEKPRKLEDWVLCFGVFNAYWSDTVSLPLSAFSLSC